MPETSQQPPNKALHPTAYSSVRFGRKLPSLSPLPAAGELGRCAAALALSKACCEYSVAETWLREVRVLASGFRRLKVSCSGAAFWAFGRAAFRLWRSFWFLWARRFCSHAAFGFRRLTRSCSAQSTLGAQRRRKSSNSSTTRRCTRPPTAPFPALASSLRSLRFRRRVSLVVVLRASAFRWRCRFAGRRYFAARVESFLSALLVAATSLLSVRRFCRGEVRPSLRLPCVLRRASVGFVGRRCFVARAGSTRVGVSAVRARLLW